MMPLPCFEKTTPLPAGGQSLMPMLNMRFVLPDDVIDINRIEDLSYIRDDGDALVFGGMVRQRDIEFSGLVSQKILMKEAILNVGHRQTRTRGTTAARCHISIPVPNFQPCPWPRMPSLGA